MDRGVVPQDRQSHSLTLCPGTEVHELGVTSQGEVVRPLSWLYDSPSQDTAWRVSADLDALHEAEDGPWSFLPEDRAGSRELDLR